MLAKQRGSLFTLQIYLKDIGQKQQKKEPAIRNNSPSLHGSSSSEASDGQAHTTLAIAHGSSAGQDSGGRGRLTGPKAPSFTGDRAMRYGNHSSQSSACGGASPGLSTSCRLHLLATDLRAWTESN